MKLFHALAAAAALVAFGFSDQAFAQARGTANYPAPTEADYVIRDFKFRSSESLPELRMHYRAFGSLQRDEKGIVRNAVLILHGTTGGSAQFMRAEFAAQMRDTAFRARVLNGNTTPDMLRPSFVTITLSEIISHQRAALG